MVARHPWGLPVTVLLISIAATVFSYAPGLHGPFVFDDSVNISQNTALRLHEPGFDALLDAARSGEAGALRRPLASISFALNYLATGGADNTFPFKLTNLFIHLANGLLVWWFSTLIFRQLAQRGFVIAKHIYWLSTIAACLWLLHPLHVTSVLYTVQRMTSLSALFVLAGGIAFLYGRQALLTRPLLGIGLMWGGICAGTAMGLLAKENAILLPLFAVILELTLFTRAPLLRQRLVLAYAPFLAMSAIAAIYVLVRFGDLILAGYQVREFTLAERMMTEARVLWFYVQLMVLPSVENLSVYHDDIIASTGLLTPWTTAFAVAGWAIAIVLAFHKKLSAPHLSFAILWYLAGHSLESTIIPLELVHEHRNYVPSIGLVIGAVTSANRLLARQPTRWLPPLITGLIVLGLFSATRVLATAWQDDRSLAEFLLRNHPKSARAHAHYAEMKLDKDGDVFSVAKHYASAADLAPHEPAYRLRAAMFHAIALNRNLSSTTARTSATETLPAPARMDVLLSQLRSGPIHARTVTALRAIIDCIESDAVACRLLRAQTPAWLEAALENPRCTPGNRKALFVQLTRLHIVQRDIDAALATAANARATYPEDRTLLLAEANVLFLAGRHNAARQRLAELARTDKNLHVHESTEIERLRRLLDKPGLR